MFNQNKKRRVKTKVKSSLRLTNRIANKLIKPIIRIGVIIFIINKFEFKITDKIKSWINKKEIEKLKK